MVYLWSLPSTKFPLDTEAELEAVYESCKKRNVDVVISDVWAHGGAGGRDLAEKSHSTGSRRKTASLMSMTKKTALKQN